MKHEPGKSLKITIYILNQLLPMDEIQKKGDTFFPQQQKWRKVKPEGRRSGSNRSLLGRDPPRCPNRESRETRLNHQVDCGGIFTPQKSWCSVLVFFFYWPKNLTFKFHQRGTNSRPFFTLLAWEYFSEAFYCGWSVLTHPVNVKFARHLQ